MPEFVYDVPTNTLAIWCSLIAVASIVIGVLVVKPVFRLLIGTGPDFNASVSYATAGFGLFYGLPGRCEHAARRIRENITTPPATPAEVGLEAPAAAPSSAN